MPSPTSDPPTESLSGGVTLVPAVVEKPKPQDANHMDDAPEYHNPLLSRPGMRISFPIPPAAPGWLRLVLGELSGWSLCQQWEHVLHMWVNLEAYRQFPEDGRVSTI